MDQPVELIGLICSRCETPVPAEPEEVAWVCGQCGQGWSLEEERGLAPLPVYYDSRVAPNATGKPFWVADGNVSLQRETYGWIGKKTGESEQFWNQSRKFLIPAFTCTLEELLSIGTRLLLQPPELQPGPAARFDSVTLAVEDLRATAEFIVIAIEAGRKDKLKKIEFSLRLSSPVLWILP